LNNFAETTIHTYTRVVQDFAVFFHRSPDKLGPEEVRQYLFLAAATRVIVTQGLSAPTMGIAKEADHH
jgi:hypothetical protein